MIRTPILIHVLHALTNKLSEGHDKNDRISNAQGRKCNVDLETTKIREIVKIEQMRSAELSPRELNQSKIIESLALNTIHTQPFKISYTQTLKSKLYPRNKLQAKVENE